MKTTEVTSNVLFATEVRDVFGCVFKNVVVLEDGEYLVRQDDIENDVVWNTTPVRSFSALDAAIEFAKQ